MSLAQLQEFLLWCTLINMGLLLFWFLMFSLARNWVYRLHSRWFKLSPESFDRIHYSAMVFFKISVILFNLIPYVALHLVA